MDLFISIMGFAGFGIIVLASPILIVTTIIGFVEKDFKYFKTTLKIWGAGLLMLVIAMIVFVILQTLTNI